MTRPCCALPLGPTFMPGIAPTYRCRSEPQMAVEVTRSTTSCHSWTRWGKTQARRVERREAARPGSCLGSKQGRSAHRAAA